MFLLCNMNSKDMRDRRKGRAKRQGRLLNESLYKHGKRFRLS